MIVITTPTGDIGSRLLHLLLQDPHGEQLRVVVRDPAKLSDDVRGRVDIVTGSHGLGALARLAMGSVTTKLVALSKIPVLVIPKG